MGRGAPLPIARISARSPFRLCQAACQLLLAQIEADMPRLTRCDRLQPGLYLLASRLEERRQRELLPEVLRVLVCGEPGTVGCDLEEHPSGLAEVDRTEVVTVDLRRHAKTGAPYPLAPGSVFLIVRRPKGDVVHAALSQVSLRRPWTLDHPYLSPRSSRTDLEVD